mgnify:CR=1 FL=1
MNASPKSVSRDTDQQLSIAFAYENDTSTKEATKVKITNMLH